MQMRKHKICYYLRRRDDRDTFRKLDGRRAQAGRGTGRDRRADEQTNIA